MEQDPREELTKMFKIAKAVVVTIVLAWFVISIYVGLK